MGKTRELLEKIRDTKGTFHAKKESEVTQSCPTLCDLMDGSLPGSSVHGIFQARILEWVAVSTIKDRSGMDLTEAEGGKNTQKNYTKKTCMIQITTKV